LARRLAIGNGGVEHALLHGVEIELPLACAIRCPIISSGPPSTMRAMRAMRSARRLRQRGGGTQADRDGDGGNPGDRAESAVERHIVSFR
jgi:hypothetical protein